MKKVQLGQIFEYLPKSKFKAGEGKEKGKYKFFTSSNIQNKFIDEFIYDGEFLIFGTGGKASINYCNDKFSTSTDNFVIKVHKEFCAKLIYLYFKHNMTKLENGFKGASIKHISKEYINQLIIPKYDYEEQLRIVNELDRVQEVIDIKEKQREELNLFIKSQFVQMFGNPIELLKQGKTQPLECFYNEITVGYVGEASKEYVDIGVPYLRTQNVRVNNIDFNGLIYINENFHSRNKKSIIHPGDIVISRVGSNRGMAAVIPNELKEANIANCLIIKNNSQIDSNYIAYFLNLSFNTHPKFGNSVGSAQGVINTAILKKWEVYVPSLEKQTEFKKIIKLIDKQKLDIQKSLAEMKKLQESLMNKYFGG